MRPIEPDRVDLKLFHRTVSSKTTYGQILLRNPQNSPDIGKTVHFIEDVGILYYENILQVYHILQPHVFQKYVFERRKIKMDIVHVEKFSPDVHYPILNIHGYEATDPEFVHINYDSLLLVSLSGGNVGEIRIIDIKTGKACCSIEVPFVVTHFMPINIKSVLDTVEATPALKSTRKKRGRTTQKKKKTSGDDETLVVSRMLWPVILGCKDCSIILMDLYFDKHDALHFADMIHDISSHNYRDFNEITKGMIHGYVVINNEYLVENSFLYPEPQGNEISSPIRQAKQLNREEITITSMKYIQSIQTFVVGFSNGGFQLWSLRKMGLEFCSILNEKNSPVARIEYLEYTSSYLAKRTLLLFIACGGVTTSYITRKADVSLTTYILNVENDGFNADITYYEPNSVKEMTTGDNKGRIVSLNKLSRNGILFITYELFRGFGNINEKELIMEVFDVKRLDELVESNKSTEKLLPAIDHAFDVYSFGLVSRNSALDSAVVPSMCTKFEEADTSYFNSLLPNNQHNLSFHVICLSENGFFDVSYLSFNERVLKDLSDKGVVYLKKPKEAYNLLSQETLKDSDPLEALLDMFFFYNMHTTIIDYIDSLPVEDYEYKPIVFEEHDLSIVAPVVLEEWLKNRIGFVESQLGSMLDRIGMSSTSEVMELVTTSKWLRMIYDIVLAIQHNILSQPMENEYGEVENGLNDFLEKMKMKEDLLKFLTWCYDNGLFKVFSSRSKKRKNTKKTDLFIVKFLGDKKLAYPLSYISDVISLFKDSYTSANKKVPTLILYDLFDKQLQNSEINDEVIEDFCLLFQIEGPLMDLTHAIWHLDQESYKEAYSILSTPHMLASVTPELAKEILRQLYDFNELELCKNYYLTRKPKLSTTEDYNLIMCVFLVNELYIDALKLIRKSPDIKILVELLIQHCVTNDRLDVFYDLPFNPSEQKVIEEYLDKELLVLYHLQRNQHKEAYDILSQHVWDEKNAKFWKNLVANYNQILPPHKRMELSQIGARSRNRN